MSKTVEAGAVAHFSDGQKTHWAIVLNLSDDTKEAWSLFLTSNPLWNRRSRKASSDELAMCGFNATKETFLAPVIRPVSDAKSHGIYFPPDRVEEFKKEFAPDPFAEFIFKLPDDIYPPTRIVKSEMPAMSLIDFFTKGKYDDNGLSEEERLEFHRYTSGLKVLPRSRLKFFLSKFPLMERFFVRRKSITLSLQVTWEATGRILAEFLEKKKIPRKLLAARAGLPERDILDFEEGIQCPSYTEMLTMVAFLPGVPDEWCLPATVPLFSDVLAISMSRHGWTDAKASAALRIPHSRIVNIVYDQCRPSITELKRFQVVCRDLPPWRQYAHYLDGLVDFEEEVKHNKINSRLL